MYQQSSAIKRLSAPIQTDMANEWFSFVSPNHFWMRWRYEALKRYRHLLPSPGAQILEVGCGSGTFLSQLKDGQYNYSLHGCDLNESALTQVPTNLGEIWCYDIHERRPSLAAHFDAIFLMDVIEHIDDDRTFLASSIHHLKPGGVVVINVPAHQQFYSKYDQLAGHKRRYNTTEMQSLLSGAGLQTEVLSYWGALLTPTLLARKALMPFVSERNVIRTGFEPPHAALHRFFSLLMRVELALPEFPFGTSVLAIARKV